MKDYQQDVGVRHVVHQLSENVCGCSLICGFSLLIGKKKNTKYYYLNGVYCLVLD